MADVIRIGVFFDGTGNDKDNDLLIGDKSETNIAKIYQMYKDQGYLTSYIEGVGTRKLTQAEIDSVKAGTTKRDDYYSSTDMAFGIGADDKVNKMMSDIKDIIANLPQGQKIVIDVYGFSRGATEARDFINEFNAQYADLDGSAIGFVGLFDTVSSIGFANDINIGFNLNLNDASAAKIVQINAANEMRANFPLESLGNGTNRVEISMIGAHADIGGGYGNLKADTEEIIILNAVNESFTPIAIAETAIQEWADRIAELEAQAQIMSSAQGKVIKFEYDKHLTYDRNGNLELRGALVEKRQVGFGLSNNALHKMYEYMYTQGISLNLSNYPMVPNSSDYIHTSSMNRVYTRTEFTDWLANREEWSPIDSTRDTHPNYPLEAEIKLVTLSAEDKTILHYLEADKYTIIGTEKQFDEITKDIVQNAPTFMTDRLEFINQYLSDNPDQSGTLYQDHYSGKSYYGQKINGISLVDFGASGDNILVYDTNNDGQIVYAKEGDDIVYTAGGNDVLDGGAGSDTLLGGEGFDTYYSSDGDTIDDSDGKGRVYFEGKLLTGGTKEAGAGCGPSEDDGSSVYKGDGGEYRLSGSTLTFTKDGEILTIEDYTNAQLNIKLKDNPADNGACPQSGHCPTPVRPSYHLSFSLPSVQHVIPMTTQTINAIYNAPQPNVSTQQLTTASASTPHSYSPPAPSNCTYYPNDDCIGAGGGASGTGPIVLDLNRNGITSISMAASIALFDYDGDGIKENTAWIESGDALLVNDVNNDGIINNASELFGNYTRNSDGSVAKSGYQALSYYDTNGDSVIDATDTRYNELSVWIDANGDGVTDVGELKTITEAGVTSLKLGDPATPYAPTVEETNTIIQETTFTDAAGEGVMRDVLFRYENNSKPTEGVYFDMDGNGIQEKMLTWTEPNQWMVVKDLNGDGKITSGREIVGNQMILRNGTKPTDTIQALKTFDINHDGVVDVADNSGLAFWTDRNHNGLTDIGELEALGDAGAIQVIKLNPYQTLLSGYDNGDGVINNNDNLSNYLYIQTNADDTITLYLPDNDMARAMIAGYIGGESIQTSDGEKIIKSIQFYAGYEMALNDTLDGTENSETLEGSSRDETIRGFGGRDIIDAGAGNDTLEGGTGSDKLMGGTGDDTYVFNRGDGKDLVIDTSGNDTIRFANGITRDDLIIKSNGIDISIYLKDGTKPISELSDHIIIKDWYTTGAAENIAFSDGSTMSATSLFESSNSEDKTSITLNGATDALIISNPQDFNVTAGLTLTSTFSYNGMGIGYQSTTYGMLVTKAYTNYESSYMMAIDSTGKLFFQVMEADNTSHRIYSTTTLYTGELYDVAATYDKASGMSKIYINGALDTEVNVGSFNIMQSSQRVVIGAYWAGGGSLRSFLNGTVSDVQIYDRSLSESEVNAISNGGIASSSLLTHYDFEDTNPFENKAGGGFIATSVGNPIISGIIETANFSDSFENITTDSTLKINTIESMVDSDISSLTLQSRYTGSELFGNYTRNSDGSVAKSGYQALSYYDSNSDGVIDASDSRFSELSPWIDANGDGMTDTGELKTLSEMGVTSLTLNDPTKPYAPTVEETNTIIQETTFTDAQGEGVMRDVLFRYENNTSNTKGVYFDMDGNGIQEKMLTWTDPNEWMVVKDINGDGIINSGREVVGNQMILSNGTKAADTIQALKTFDINHDGKIDTADNSGLAFWTDRNHNGITDIGELEALGAAGAIQTIKLNPYQTLLSGYDNGDGVINNGDAVSNYLYIQSNSDDTITLYLPDNAQARSMIAGYTGGESIQTSQGEKIIKTIQFYSGYEMALNDTLDGPSGNDTIDMLEGNDTLTTGSGNDTLIGGSGNDTYHFDLGDGQDTITDNSGIDTIEFGNGIGIDDLVFYTGPNSTYMMIGVKEAGKSIWELRDKITITDWRHSSVKKFSLQGSGSGIDGTDGDLFFSKSEILRKAA